MKKIVALIICLIFLTSFFISITLLTMGNGHQIKKKAKFAFIIWGTRDYRNETYTGAEPEYNASRDVCSKIYDVVASSQKYTYCKNFWGTKTQPNQVYNNVSYCEENYNFTAIFYKGHSIGSECSLEDCKYGEHWGLYADEGYGSEYIQDYLIHNRISSGIHDFVFLWTCGYGTKVRIGEIDDSAHSVGMLTSWINTNSLEDDGYASPDGTNHCFIGFDNYSIWFTNRTGFGNYDYGNFVSLFFEYAMNDCWTINDALDAAAEETHMQSSFGECQLYTGYLMPDPDNSGYSILSYMRVWGDGNLKLNERGEKDQ